MTYSFLVLKNQVDIYQNLQFKQVLDPVWKHGIGGNTGGNL